MKGKYINTETDEDILESLIKIRIMRERVRKELSD